MRAHLNLKAKPIKLKKTQEVKEKEEGAKKKAERRISKLNNFITKSVNYYADEEFRKHGGPLRWID